MRRPELRVQNTLCRVALEFFSARNKEWFRQQITLFRSVMSTSTQPVNKLSLFHSDWPWRRRTSFDTLHSTKSGRGIRQRYLSEELRGSRPNMASQSADYEPVAALAQAMGRFPPPATPSALRRISPRSASPGNQERASLSASAGVRPRSRRP